MLGNLSLTLKNVNASDAGLYACFAWDGWECVMARNVTLKVKDCVTLESILAPTNGTAILPCTFPNTSEDTQRVNITWNLVLAEKHPSLLQYPPSSEQSNRGRLRFKMDPRSGDASLIISDLTHGDRNWYRCQLGLGRSSRCYEMKLEVKDFVSEETATFGTSTVTLTQRNVTDEQYSSKGVGTGTIVVIALLLASFCIFMASVGSAFYIKQCRSSPDTTDEGNLQETYYSNVDFRNSVHVLNTFYTVTHAANRWSSDQSTDSKTSDF
ncbi:uncharacterized protein LOC125749585 isoform X2 [Brienomyrus brachyistius]|nr:uncharacterized protein LOC125749585 isoform X2 [Brienomyrus brachyistius]